MLNPIQLFETCLKLKINKKILTRYLPGYPTNSESPKKIIINSLHIPRRTPFKNHSKTLIWSVPTRSFKFLNQSH